MQQDIKYTITGIFKKVANFECPNCHTNLSTALKDAGTRDKCPSCECEFVSPGSEILEQEAASKSQRQAAKAEKQAEKQATREQSASNGVVFTSRFSQEDIDTYLRELENGRLPNLTEAAEISLPHGEICCIFVFGVLAEPTKTTIYVGGRRAGFFAGMPLDFKGVDATQGTLYVTSKRLLFVGENSATTEWPLRNVLSATATERKGILGITLATTTHQGRTFYSRDRPLVTISIAAINKVLKMQNGG